MSQFVKTSLKKLLKEIDSSRDVLFYDSAVALPAYFKNNFVASKKMKAGEQVKTLDSFAKVLTYLQQLEKKHSLAKPRLWIVGGGSIGDSLSFVASVWKRGVDHFLVPSTYLALVDSSHGGKTALNFNSKKNQIGSFYTPKKTFWVPSLFKTTNEALAQEAWAEVFKMAVIAGPRAAWAKKFFSLKRSSRFSYKNNIQLFVKNAVQEKLKVVKRDPFEQKGIRQILNLGHTWAHLVEKQKNISHGHAVAYGLKFALDFSFFKNNLSQEKYDLYKNLLLKDFPFLSQPLTLKSNFVSSGLSSDKKSLDSKIAHYVFFDSKSGAVVKRVKQKDIYDFAKSHGCIKG